MAIQSHQQALNLLKIQTTNPTEAEIRKAYKILAMKKHPDKIIYPDNATEAEKDALLKQRTEEFGLLKEAEEFLLDPPKPKSAAFDDIFNAFFQGTPYQNFFTNNGSSFGFNDSFFNQYQADANGFNHNEKPKRAYTNPNPKPAPTARPVRTEKPNVRPQPAPATQPDVPPENEIPKPRFNPKPKSRFSPKPIPTAQPVGAEKPNVPPQPGPTPQQPGQTEIPNEVPKPAPDKQPPSPPYTSNERKTRFLRNFIFGSILGHVYASLQRYTLMTMLGIGAGVGIAVSIFAALRNYFINRAVKQYTPQKIDSLNSTTQQSEIDALIAGVNAKTGKGYFSSFLNFSTYRHPSAFAAAMESKDTAVFQAIKKKSVFRR